MCEKTETTRKKIDNGKKGLSTFVWLAYEAEKSEGEEEQL